MQTHTDKKTTLAERQDDNVLIQPRKSILIKALIDADQHENPIVKKYLEQYEEYSKKFIEQRNSIVKKENEIFPDLQPINPESLYQIFKDNFQIVTGKVFNESHNDFASRKLARTLLAYFIGNTSFLKNPLLNEKSVPSLEKGLAIFGDFGVGKSAIVETFYKIFRYAENNRLMVHDKFGTEQILGRYKLSFGYDTSNSVVQEFEAIKRSENKPAEDYNLNHFIKKHHHGFRNYDDVMSERMASSYGKTEIFKEIFEERYSNRAKTMISLNYIEMDLDKTLEAFAEKYGERLYDRFFEMFNIIEVKGNSLRK